MLAYGKAVEALRDVKTVEEFRELVSKVSVATDGSPTLLFSGMVGGGSWFGSVVDEIADSEPSLRTIRTADISSFLDVGENPELFDALLRIFPGSNPNNEDSEAARFLNGEVGPDGKRIPNGIWDEVSRRFIEEARGEVKVLTALDHPNGVFAQTELPALLENSKVTSIEGIPREHLVDLMNNKQPDGIEAVRRVVAARAQVNIRLSGVANGDFSRYLEFDDKQLTTALKDPDNLRMVADLLNDPDPDIRATMRLAVDDMLDGARFSAERGVGRSLNRLGIVGGALDFLRVSYDVAGAASFDEGVGILTEWAAETAGGEIGSIAGSALAGIALAAAGVGAGPVAGAMVLAASMAGGFLGAEWADEFYAFLKSKDDAQRADIVKRLGVLYFGEGYEVDASNTPSMESNFYLIDTAISSDAMYQAAKGDLAWRYALAKLNPFVVPEANYQGLHNRDGELDLYAAGSPLGLTDEFLRARADALREKVLLLRDGESVRPGQPFPGGHDHPYLDAEEAFGTMHSSAEVALHDVDGFKDQRLFGGAGSDLVQGGRGSDMLFGGGGDDVLDGRGAGDYLEGATGHDTYLAGAGDLVFDSDGKGSLYFDGELILGGSRSAGGDGFRDEAGRFHLAEANGDLLVNRIEDGLGLVVRGFQNGDLGILLRDERHPPATPSDIVVGTDREDHIEGTIGATGPGIDWDALNEFNLGDHVVAGGGRDWVFAWQEPDRGNDGEFRGEAPDTDIVEGGAGSDFIFGGPGDDRLHATDLADLLEVTARGVQEGPQGVEAGIGDLLSGGADDDQLYGSRLGDGLFGGDDADLIYGWAGDDQIYGDWQPYLRGPIGEDYEWIQFDASGRATINIDYRTGIGDDRIFAGAGADTVFGEAGDDLIYGEGGDDVLSGDIAGVRKDGTPKIPLTLHGRDTLFGGPGDDGISGNGGDDRLFGDDGDDWLDGDFRLLGTVDLPFLGDDWLDGGAGADTLIGNGGADVLLGGNGDDRLYGDLAGLERSYHGNDRLYGGEGMDQLFGQGGDDVLFGGDDSDLIYGDDVDDDAEGGDDWLSGGQGYDDLLGGRGRDTIDGGAGDDRLWGGAGDDVLRGGAGFDYLDGGDGADAYVFAPGDSPAVGGGLETIADLDSGSNRVVFSGGIPSGGVVGSVVGSNGDLLLRFGDDDAVVVAEGLTGAVTEFAFDTGRTACFQEFVTWSLPNARFLEGGDGDDLVFGSADSDRVVGGEGVDELYGGAGDDELRGGSGSDVLVGGRGDDLLDGGAGSDTYRFAQGHGGDAVVDSGGHDVIFLGDASLETAEFIREGANLRIQVGADHLVIREWETGTVEQVRFGDSTVVVLSKVLAGSPDTGRFLSEDDVIGGHAHGSAGDDLFDVHLEGVSLSGGDGDDVYVLSSSHGYAQVDDESGFNTIVLSGHTDSPVTFMKDDADLFILMNGRPAAQIRNGLVARPGRIVLPDGAALDGSTLAEVIDAAEVGNPMQQASPYVVKSAEFPRMNGFEYQVVDRAGDINGDGFDDLLVRAVWQEAFEDVEELDGLLNMRDAGYLVLGQAGGWQDGGSVHAVQIFDHGLSELVPSPFSNWQIYDDFLGPMLLRALGDLDGDGWDDFASAYSEGGKSGVSLHFGSPGLLVNESAVTLGALLQGAGPPSSIEIAPTDVVTSLDTLDWNGDGRSDLLIGTASRSNLHSTQLFILPDAADLRGRELRIEDLAQDGAFDPIELDQHGRRQSARPVGDVNGDGKEDVILAVERDNATPNGTRGWTWGIVYGGGAGGVVDQLNPEPGLATTLRVNGAFPLHQMFATGIGDLNDDGFSDILVKFEYENPWVLFGGPTLPAEIDLAELSGSEGFRLAGFPTPYYDFAGFDVASGDINGDGVTDLVMGTYAVAAIEGTQESHGNGVAYVLFGGHDGYPAVVDLMALDESMGFRFVAPYPDVPTFIGHMSPLPGMAQIAVADLDGDGADDVVKTAFEGDASDPLATPTLQVLYGLGEGVDGHQASTEGDDIVFIDEQGHYFTYGGNDFVVVKAMPWDVTVDTGAGDDELHVDLDPRNFPSGQGGTLSLFGGDGDDVVSLDIPGGASGVKVPMNEINLFGGSGSDTYLVTGRGLKSLKVRVNDPWGGSGGNSLVLGDGFDHNSIQLRFGSLMLGFLGDDIEIHLENFDRHDVLNGPRDIDWFEFADGTRLSYEELVAKGFDVSGTEGEDLLEGSSVSDRLYGYGSDDRIIGDLGDDTLVGGAGDDLLDGGLGDDAYHLAIGDGNDFVEDSGGEDTVVFGPSVTLQSLDIKREGLDLRIGYGPADSLLVRGWFETRERPIEALVFADGARLGSADIDELAASGLSVIRGGRGQDLILGSASAERIEGGAGRDVIYGRAGDDVIDGGRGRDRLFGGEGNDTFLVSGDVDQYWGGSGFDTILGDARNDRIFVGAVFGDGNGIEAIDGGAGVNRIIGSRRGDRLDFEGVQISNVRSIHGGAGDDWISGTQTADVIFGGADDDVIRGGAGDDILFGGRGVDELDGGTGDDSYKIRTGDGMDRVRDPSGVDEVVFTRSNHDQLWFSRSGADLLVSVCGTADAVLVEDWYRGASHQIEHFVTADSRVLASGDVERLVDAMAGFSVAPSEGIDFGRTVPDQIGATLAAVWQ